MAVAEPITYDELLETIKNHKECINTILKDLEDKDLPKELRAEKYLSLARIACRLANDYHSVKRYDKYELSTYYRVVDTEDIKW